jgi:hypothetical protein
MGQKSGSGSGFRIRDHISESLETIFWVKILKFLCRSGMEKIRIRDKHPGSATLISIHGHGRKKKVSCFESLDVVSGTLETSAAWKLDSRGLRRNMSQFLSNC